MSLEAREECQRFIEENSDYIILWEKSSDPVRRAVAITLKTVAGVEGTTTHS